MTVRGAVLLVVAASACGGSTPTPDGMRADFASQDAAAASDMASVSDVGAHADLAGDLAARHTGAVNWLDPLDYPKPIYVALHEPDETATTNRYWIDLTNGNGTSCTQSAPCGSFDDVLGKPGTKGGPAVLYVKGKGGMDLYEDTIYGSGDADCRTESCDDWILIRTWPAGSPGCETECSATITGDSNLNSTNVHHIVFDGGPDLKISFLSDGKAGQYANAIQADYVTVYRTQMSCAGNNQELGWSVGSFAVSNNVSFINNELFGCATTGDQVSAVYVGPGAGGGYKNFLFQNNIVRDFYGEGIEINPRVTSSGLTIVGNAFHGVGKGTCGGPWQCRPAITVSIQSGNGNDSTLIADNLMWDTGSGCVWDRGGGTPTPIIADNTCFDYAQGGSDAPNPQGISGYENGGTAMVTNNIVYSSNGVAPFDDSPFVASHNLCAAGASCGTASAKWSSNTVVSTDPSHAAFLALGASSEARNQGVAVTVVTIDYVGVARPHDNAYDIGALEY